jgi:hypothetical protein
MIKKHPTAPHFRKVWLIPIILTLLILGGLLTALLATGIWQALSWVALVIPLLVICWKVLHSDKV